MTYLRLRRRGATHRGTTYPRVFIAYAQADLPLALALLRMIGSGEYRTPWGLRRRRR
jgi:hypothetical protein